MQTPLRILRRRAIEIEPALADLTPRQLLREQRILAVATDLFARFGPHAMSFTSLAQAMKMAPATMRWHFADLHALLGAIMRRHLQTLLFALDAVPANAPNRQRLQREAYLNATRAGAGLTPAHHILTAYRAQLPEDERELVDALRGRIAAILGGPRAHEALTLLDSPCFELDQIERMLAATAAAPVPAAAPPATLPIIQPSTIRPAPAGSPRLRAPPEALAA